MFLNRLIPFCLILAVLGYTRVAAGQDCGVFPADNIWNTPVDNLPPDPNSAAYIAAIGPNLNLQADFGSGDWPPGSGSPIGIPYVTVPGTQSKVQVSFDYRDESDPGPYPIPADAPIEGDPQSGGDRHVLIIDRDNCLLYELFDAFPQADGSWHAGSGAIFDLKSDKLRPAGWTSADAAGLPIFPGLVRYDEVASGAIHHALRFTAPTTQKAYVWPARHYASSHTETNYPPMGERFRLKAGFDISGFSPQTQVILTALKRYGMILADNGSAWYISGAPDQRWNNDVLHELGQVAGSNFEAVDESSLMVSPDSAATNPAVVLWQDAAGCGGGWYYLSPFGAFNTNASPWIYHETLGWLYPAGTSTDSTWFYDPQWDGTGGWWWSSSSLFPWVYSATENEWLYYDASDSTLSSRWFFTGSGQASTH